MRKILPTRLSVSLVLVLAIICSGCSTAWVATLDSILAAAAPALINILQIVAVAQGTPLNTVLVAKISADAAVVKTVASDFAKASAGSGAGVCQQLEAAVSVYAGDQQLVLQAAQVSDPRTQAKISALVELVAGTISAVTAAIPACQSSTAHSAVIATVPLSVTTFVNDYNRTLVTITGDAAVDSMTGRLVLHRHSKIVRMATFGKLQ